MIPFIASAHAQDTAAAPPGGEMFQLREFDLQLALRTLRPQGEDIEDQAGAIDDTALQFALEVALLRRRKLVVEDDEFAFVCGNRGADFLHLPLAGESRGIGTVAASEDDIADHRPGGFSKQADFLDLFGNVFPTEVELDDHRTFASGGTFKHVSGRRIRPRAS